MNMSKASVVDWFRTGKLLGNGAWLEQVGIWGHASAYWLPQGEYIFSAKSFSHMPNGSGASKKSKTGTQSNCAPPP